MIVRGFVVLALAALTAACGPAVDPATLPDVPEVSIESYQTGVRRQIEEALAAYRASPTSARRNGELAMLFRAYRDFDAAAALFTRASLLAPRNVDWQYHLCMPTHRAQYSYAYISFSSPPRMPAPKQRRSVC